MDSGGVIIVTVVCSCDSIYIYRHNSLHQFSESLMGSSWKHRPKPMHVGFDLENGYFLDQCPDRVIESNRVDIIM